MSKAARSTHVRLCDEADAELEAVALADGRDKAKIAREILHDARLGRGGRWRLAADRMRRAGFVGSGGS